MPRASRARPVQFLLARCIAEDLFDLLGRILSDPTDPKNEFVNPILWNTAGEFDATSIAVSHPLGGCIIRLDASEGVVDEFGRVFDKTKSGDHFDDFCTIAQNPQPNR